jgi:hypothetical protein
MGDIRVSYDGKNFIVTQGVIRKIREFKSGDLKISDANVPDIENFNKLFRRKDIEKDAKESPSVKNIDNLMNTMFPSIKMNKIAVGLPNLEKLKKIIKDSADFISHSWLKTGSLKTRLPIQYVFYETGNSPSEFIKEGGEFIGNFASEVGDPFIRKSPKKFWPEMNVKITFDNSILSFMGVPGTTNSYEATMFPGKPYPLFEYNINVMDQLFGTMGNKISRVRNTIGYEYFQGNSKKNSEINKEIDRGTLVLTSEKIKHFWGKEYGDMMQVMFMLAWKIFTVANDADFAMVTTDDVVFVTSILLKLPCVYTYFKNEKGIQNKDKLYRIQQYQGYDVDPVERKKRIVDMVEKSILENNNNIINTLNTILRMSSVSIFLGMNENIINFDTQPGVKEWFELRIADINRINLQLTTSGRQISVNDDTVIQETNRKMYLVNEFIINKKGNTYKIFPGIKTYTHTGVISNNKIHFATTFQRAYSQKMRGGNYGGVITSLTARRAEYEKIRGNLGKVGKIGKEKRKNPNIIEVRKRLATVPINRQKSAISGETYAMSEEISIENNIIFIKKQIAEFCKTINKDELQKKYLSIFIPEVQHGIPNFSGILDDLRDTLYHRLAYYSYIFGWVPYDNYLMEWLKNIYDISYTDTDTETSVDEIVMNNINDLYLRQKTEAEKEMTPSVKEESERSRSRDRKSERSRSRDRKLGGISKRKTQKRNK